MTIQLKVNRVMDVISAPLTLASATSFALHSIMFAAFSDRDLFCRTKLRSIRELSTIRRTKGMIPMKIKFIQMQ